MHIEKKLSGYVKLKDCIEVCYSIQKVLSTGTQSMEFRNDGKIVLKNIFISIHIYVEDLAGYILKL